jgi:hypothetical protein
MHSQLRKNVQVQREGFEEEKDGETRHEKRSCRGFPPGVYTILNRFNDEQDGGGQRRHEKQEDENSEA